MVYLPEDLMDLNITLASTSTTYQCQSICGQTHEAMQPVINITMKSYSKIWIGEARPGAMWPEKQETGEPLSTVTAMWFLWSWLAVNTESYLQHVCSRISVNVCLPFQMLISQRSGKATKGITDQSICCAFFRLRENRKQHSYCLAVSCKWQKDTENLGPRSSNIMVIHLLEFNTLKKALLYFQF